MWRRRYRRRRGRRGRFPKPVTLGMIPPITGLIPNPARNLEPIFIDIAELEAFRLVDLEGLSQEEAGQKMGVSRGTVWRLLQNARRKTAQAITEGRPLQIVSEAK
ncbi:MAG: DUF134 domain-containing protein [Candidatus Bathyarchaeota archaeon]|nr:DUF134 domain-containing protein [Candidatus Bathyarchaeota archaeon]